MHTVIRTQQKLIRAQVVCSEIHNELLTPPPPKKMFYSICLETFSVSVHVTVKRGNILLRREVTGTERILRCGQDTAQSKAKLWSNDHGINTRRTLNMQFTFCALTVEMVLMQGNSH